jgi:hypothetical protein
VALGAHQGTKVAKAEPVHDPQFAVSSIAKKFLEPLRRQGRIARRILNVAVAEIRLDRARVVAVVGELVSAVIFTAAA